MLFKSFYNVRFPSSYSFSSHGHHRRFLCYLMTKLLDASERCNTFVAMGTNSCNSRRFSTSTSTSTSSPIPSSSTLPVVVVKRNKIQLFLSGNPILFDGAVMRTSGQPKQGDFVLVTDPDGRNIAKGFYNPKSSYAVRIVINSNSKHFQSSFSDILRYRLVNALMLRRNNCAFIANNSDTTVYRLINGEGDNLSGLIIDILGHSVVIQSGASWVEVNKTLIMETLDSFFQDYFPPSSNNSNSSSASSSVSNSHCNHNHQQQQQGGQGGQGGQEEQRASAGTPSSSSLSSSLHTYSFIWRVVPNRLALDGFLGSTATADNDNNNNGDINSEIKKHHYQHMQQSKRETTYVLPELFDNSKQPHKSASNREEIVKENGIRYVVYPESGQKTGFYSDQRDNRLLIRSLSFNKTVLDLFCYSGGFSLNALAGNATSVIGVDSSEDAINIANRNLQLNGYRENIRNNIQHNSSSSSSNNSRSSNKARFIKEDSMEFMKAAIKMKQKFDIVICDPPKFAPKQADLSRASSKYIALNSLALQLVKPGGLLFTFSCSSAVTQGNHLLTYLQEAGYRTDKGLTLLAKRGPSVTDHPISLAFQESDYLSAILVRVDD